EPTRRTGRYEGRTGSLERRGFGVRGADRGSEARDRDAQAREVWPQRRTYRPADRPARVAARGTGNDRGRRCQTRRAGGGKGDEGSHLRPAQAGEKAVPRASAARARGGRGPRGLHLLRVRPDREDGRGHHRYAGGGAAAVEGDPDRPGEVHVSRLREDQPTARAVSSDAPGLGGSEPARDDRVREVRPAPAVEPPS